MPAIRTARCRPAVPLETAVAWRVPVNDAKSPSKRRSFGPSPRMPERSASSTSSSSRAPTSGADRLIMRVALTSAARGRGRRVVEVVVGERRAAVHEIEEVLLDLARDRTGGGLVVGDRAGRGDLG